MTAPGDGHRKPLDRLRPDALPAADFSRTGPFLFLVALLAGLGITAATLRHTLYDIPLWPGEQTQIWQIDARIEFQANTEPAQVKLELPPAQDGFEILSEAPASSGWGFAVENVDGSAGPSRRALWSQRNPDGRQVLFYKLALATSDQSHPELSIQITVRRHSFALPP